VSEAQVAAIRSAMPELPDARRRRFTTAFGLPEYDAAQLTQSRAAADFFERTVAAGAPPKTASNWIRGELARALKEAGRDLSDPPVSAERLAALIALIEGGTISGAIAKDVFEKMVGTGRSAEEIVAAEGLTQIDDERQIAAIVERVLAANADAVAQYRGGRAATFGFLVGQVMKAAGGKANPKRVNELLRRTLDAA
jgi:aspartyl-tRNA(Asn)/glutamyl-tRNA(Gln) amidotransferase subunit B